MDRVLVQVEHLVLRVEWAAARLERTVRRVVAERWLTTAVAPKVRLVRRPVAMLEEELAQRLPAAMAAMVRALAGP